MSAWQPIVGSSLLIPAGNEFHLFVVLRGPMLVAGYGANPQLFLANFTTLHPGIPHDPACVVQGGCHPFITHESFVRYRLMRIEPVPHLLAMVNAGVWRPHHGADAGLVQSIGCRGLFVSVNAKSLQDSFWLSLITNATDGRNLFWQL